MSPAAITLVALLVVAVVVAVVLVIRMNREPEVARDDTEMLPLFTSMGVMNEGYRPDGESEGEDPAASAEAALLAAARREVAKKEAAQREAAQRESAERMAAQRAAAQRETAQREAMQREEAARAAATRPAMAEPASAVAPAISPAELERMKAAASAAPNGAPRTPPTVRTFNTAAPPQQPAPRQSSAVPAPRPSPAAPPAGAAAPVTPVRMTGGESMVFFNVPNDGTLQFLPGRLEVASGQDTGREIRFVRLPGPQGSEFTFGRSEGELYRHIQLRDQTVSRAHAKMRFAEGRWFLQNLSQTNPVVHDGRPLATGEELPLEDGARIEMGEVLFAFRNR